VSGANFAVWIDEEHVVVAVEKLGGEEVYAAHNVLLRYRIKEEANQVAVEEAETAFRV